MLAYIFLKHAIDCHSFSKSYPHDELVLNYWSCNQIIYCQVFGINSQV
jgi:hypothetical protein